MGSHGHDRGPEKGCNGLDEHLARPRREVVVVMLGDPRRDIRRETVAEQQRQAASTRLLQGEQIAGASMSLIRSGRPDPVAA